jgi:hypothetical protein
VTAYTLTTLTTAVRDRGDLPLSRKFTDAFVQREIQTAWTELHRLIDRANEGWFDTEGSVSTVANQAYVALPATCRLVKGVDFLDGSDYRELRQVPIGVRNRWATSDRGEPEAYRLTERGIDLYPTPGAVYTLRVTFSRKVVALSGASQELDDEWWDYVIWSAILKIGTSEERPVGDYINARDTALSGVLASVTGRKQAEPEYLVLREYDELGGW